MPSVPAPIDSLCSADGWCPELPSTFSARTSTIRLVGDAVYVRTEDRVTYRLDGTQWSRVDCPAGAGTTDGPMFVDSPTSDTLATCGAHRYLWRASGAV